ncbi:MAG: metal-dependent hydrolase [Armatimonadota bacterium]
MAVRLTFHGHAAWSLDSGGVKILMDPFLSGNPMADVGPDEVDAEYILITHAHGDHIGDAVAIAKRTGAAVVSNYEIANWFGAQGVNAHPLHLGGGREFPFGRVELTIAHHGSSFPDGGYGGNPAGIIVKTAGRTIYNAGDTALFYDMKLIGELHKPDVALLPIGDNFTMGPEAALKAVELIKPGRVIPMHYSTFDLIAQDAEEFARRCKDEIGVECTVLKPGMSIEL